MTRGFRILLIWIVVSGVAFAIQLNWMSATYLPDGWVPVGNDAFYHARRIIDAAGDLGSFYEFDPKIHVPEGSLLVWPWGYDYGMALLLKAGQSLGWADDPVRFLAYVPPFAVLTAIALVVWIGLSLELSLVATILLALCVALSPLTQSMFGIGSIDHHFAEFLVVLASVASVLAWLRRPDSAYAAVVAGLVLGTGQCIHNGLFVLQLLPLATLAVSRMKGVALPARSTKAFGVALVASTLLVLLPSLPFREFRFEYYLLSWFHLYIAACTAVMSWVIVTAPPAGKGLLRTVFAALLLAVPLAGSLLHAGGFVGKEAPELRGIQEAGSVWDMFEERGFARVTRFYSALVFLAPLVWLGCIAALPRVREPRTILVCVHAVLALPLLFAQFRFHYYGSLALYLPLLLLADRVERPSLRRGALAAAAALLAVAYYPAIRFGLGTPIVLGNDLYYPLTRLAMPPLAEACRQDPGIVLARANDGHLIRFHTDCSVIANNFLLTEQHFESVRRVERMFGMSPTELLDSGLAVDYVFVRARGILVVATDGSVHIVPSDQARLVSDPLTDALLWTDAATPPRGFALVAEVPVPGGDYPFARIWRVTAPRGGE